MKTVRLAFGGERTESTLVCGEGAFLAARAVAGGAPGDALVFTDSNVYPLYRAEIEACFGGVPVHIMEAGEANKNETTLFRLLRAMAEAGLRRGSALLALGGGVVGDLGGLAASLYMRGISCIQIPTTLLAQVDSSVGGKTAVDFCGVKNLVGAFKQPEAVFADPLFLSTLPRRELRCGLGEIVKHGALSRPLFKRLTSAPDLFDLGFLAEIVPENIAFKAGIVQKDPREKGLRRCLNLGHTTAHAMELASGLSHGECVLWGLIFESGLAARHFETDETFRKRLVALCRSALEGGTAPPFGVSAALLDKKNTASGCVTLTVPVAAGRSEILQLPYEQYARELGEIKEELS